MRNLFALVCSAFILVSSAAFAEETRPEAAQTWRLAYANDAEGNSVAGAKDALVAALRDGKPVRVYWGGGRVEHVADAGFLTVFEGDVFAQLDAIQSQRPQADPLGVYFREPGVKWRAIIGTNGFFTAFMDGREEPNVRTSAARWFVQD